MMIIREKVPREPSTASIQQVLMPSKFVDECHTRQERPNVLCYNTSIFVLKVCNDGIYVL